MHIKKKKKREAAVVDCKSVLYTLWGKLRMCYRATYIVHTFINMF